MIEIKRPMAREELRAAQERYALTANMLGACSIYPVALRADGTLHFVRDPYRVDLSGIHSVSALFSGAGRLACKFEDGRVAILESDLRTRALHSYEVEAYRDAVSIALGQWHSLAVMPDGTVRAEGDRDYGLCDVSGWRDIIGVAACFNGSFGLRADGTVVFTGLYADGLPLVTEWTDVVSLCASEYVVTGVRADGTFLSAGNVWLKTKGTETWRSCVQTNINMSHTLARMADGSVASNCNFSSVMPVTDWTDICAIYSYMDFTVGVREDGTVLCVGEREPKYMEEISGWKLFESLDELRERRASASFWV